MWNLVLRMEGIQFHPHYIHLEVKPMVEIYKHSIKGITLGKINQLEQTGTYTRDIVIKGEDNSELRIRLFSKTEAGILPIMK